ncbi:MAG: hypothetical protein PQJ61_01855 [Spirochaetales bacterium]|uniref:DUF5698 domain-containing protein n=1 Tax=Candidatus Thalassospirochaeta sargassi TaxID=3119039 RepID=A0AAJ1IA58_9SPIO|nr:hypothetical protein [Spirochaetales bacterium]
MEALLISGVIVFLGRILQDIVFNFKIEMFNRGKLSGVFGINFIESIIGMTVIAMVVGYIDDDPRLLLFLGLGSSVGGMIVIQIRTLMNRRLEGQRRYYARVSYVGNEDLVEILKNDEFIFTVETREFIDGMKRTIIEGSLENRARKELFKEHLKGRPDKLVTIIPASEVYWV